MYSGVYMYLILLNILTLLYIFVKEILCYFYFERNNRICVKKIDHAFALKFGKTKRPISPIAYIAPAD
jgi:hypothetical protein